MLNARARADVSQLTNLRSGQRASLVRPQIAFAAQPHLDDAGLGNRFAQAATSTQAVLHNFGDKRAFSGHGVA